MTEQANDVRKGAGEVETELVDTGIESIESVWFSEIMDQLQTDGFTREHIDAWSVELAKGLMVAIRNVYGHMLDHPGRWTEMAFNSAMTTMNMVRKASGLSRLLYGDVVCLLNRDLVAEEESTKKSEEVAEERLEEESRQGGQENRLSGESDKYYLASQCIYPPGPKSLSSLSVRTYYGFGLEIDGQLDLPATTARNV